MDLIFIGTTFVMYVHVNTQLMAKLLAVLAYPVSSEVPGLRKHGVDSRCSLNTHVLKMPCPTKRGDTYLQSSTLGDGVRGS